MRNLGCYTYSENVLINTACTLSNIIRVVKYTKLRYTGLVVRVRNSRVVYRIMLGRLLLKVEKGRKSNIQLEDGM